MMNDFFQVNTSLFTRYEFSLTIALVVIVFIIYLYRHRIKQSWLSFRSRYCLNHLGLEQIFNIQVPDGLDHYFTIERLLLRHDGITLLVYKKYSGNIFCADHIDEWTQMIGNKSYPFKNPLFELDNQIKAISAQFPDIKFDGFLFFDHTTQFPKGHPERVMHPKQVPVKLQRNNRHQVDPEVMSAWKKLQSLRQDR